MEFDKAVSTMFRVRMRQHREQMAVTNAAFNGGDAAKKLLKALTPEGEAVPGQLGEREFLNFAGGGF